VGAPHWGCQSHEDPSWIPDGAYQEGVFASTSEATAVGSMESSLVRYLCPRTSTTRTGPKRGEMGFEATNPGCRFLAFGFKTLAIEWFPLDEDFGEICQRSDKAASVVVNLIAERTWNLVSWPQNVEAALP